MSTKLPAFLFYTGDWMKDPALRALGYAARGLWMDMLCLMHECPRRGFLEYASGQPFTVEDIARMTGGEVTEVRVILASLERHMVFSKLPSGTIFSRHMERDEVIKANHRYRQNTYRNRQKDKENSDGFVTSNNGVTNTVTPASQVTALSQVSSIAFSSSISSSNANAENLPDIPAEYPRPAGAETLDMNGTSPYDASHARPHAATSDPPDAQAQAFALSEPSPTDEATDLEPIPSRQAKLQSGIIASLFAYFCEVCSHNPTQYTLTPQRLKKAHLRLQERIKLTGSLAQGVDDLKLAINNLAASEYHRTNHYLDWEAQIFRSREEFEKRLGWKAPQPQEVSHGYAHTESIEEHNERVVREANKRMAERTIEATGKPKKDENS